MLKKSIKSDVNDTPVGKKRLVDIYKTDDSYQSELYQDPSIISESSGHHSLTASSHSMNRSPLAEYKDKANVGSVGNTRHSRRS